MMMRERAKTARVSKREEDEGNGERERGWSLLSRGPSNEEDRRSVEQKSSLGAKG